MSRTPTVPLVVTVAGTAAICMAAFWLSYEALTDLADRSGVTTPWLWPLIVDGLIIVATVAVVARVGSYAWLLLLAGAAISVAGNVLHASLPDGALPVWLCATVAAVPPVALVAVTHLAVVLRRMHATATEHISVAAIERTREGHQNLESSQVTLRDTVACDTAPDLTRQAQNVIAPTSTDDADRSHLHLLAVAPATDATADDDSRAMRAKAVVLLNEGIPVCDIAEQLGVHRATVYRWRAAAS